MDDRTARELIALNNRFYVTHAASFSATRQAPWPGWKRVIGIAREAGALGAQRDGMPARVLDVACGNLRFERFLLGEAGEGLGLELHAVDSCPELAVDAGGVPGLAFHRADVLADLLAGRDPLARIPACDLVACFGFMHHIPGDKLRRAVVDALLRATAPGGVLAISFWRFMDDGRLAAKAARTDALARRRGFDAAALDAGDHFLSWQDDREALRYCHHFTEAEIDGLVEAVAPAVREIARYSADGRGGALNRYLVLAAR